MAKVKVFLKLGKTSRSRSKFFVPMERSCHKKCALKYESHTSAVGKLWPRLTFYKSRSNFKVKVTRSKFMVPIERSCYKECAYEIWKPYLFWLGSYGQGKSFLNVGQTSGSRSRSKFFVAMERSRHKECTYEIWKPYLFWLGSYGQG